MTTLHTMKRRARKQAIADELHVIAGQIVKDIDYRDGYFLETGNEDDTVFIRLAVWRLDTVTKEMGWGHSAKAWLSPSMSRSDVVRVCFGLIRAYNEHEDREFFKYKGTRIFGPHQNVELLVDAGRPTDLSAIVETEELGSSSKKTYADKPWWRA